MTASATSDRDDDRLDPPAELCHPVASARPASTTPVRPQRPQARRHAAIDAWPSRHRSRRRPPSRPTTATAADHVPADLDRVRHVRQVQVDPGRDQQERRRTGRGPGGGAPPSAAPAVEATSATASIAPEPAGSNGPSVRRGIRPPTSNRSYARNSSPRNCPRSSRRPSNQNGASTTNDSAAADPTPSVGPRAVVGQRRIAEERLAVGPRVAADPRQQGCRRSASRATRRTTTCRDPAASAARRCCGTTTRPDPTRPGAIHE